MLIDPCELSPSYVRSIAPYQPGKPISEVARELGLKEESIIKLASNEKPLGIGPRTRAAIDAALAEVARYPDGSGFGLKQALSGRYGVDPSSIVLGNGSNDVLELVAAAFLGPGRAAVMSQHAFAVYPLATQARGARSIVVPAKNFGHDLEAMARAVDDETYVVWAANPNNPTGTYARPDELEAFLRKVPERVLVVLDEAYNEYIGADLRADPVKWLRRHPNLVVTRTFSKAYGLAGLRVGYALAHPSVADVMNRVRQPFNVNSIALAAGRRRARRHGVRGSQLRREPERHAPARGRGARARARVHPLVRQFLAVHVGKAGEIFKRLLRRGVIVRPVGGYGLAEHLRVTIGTAAENERFLAALAASLRE
jgi:histidinol-phosphate aminotransferase